LETRASGRPVIGASTCILNLARQPAFPPHPVLPGLPAINIFGSGAPFCASAPFFLFSEPVYGLKGAALGCNRDEWADRDRRMG